MPISTKTKFNIFKPMLPESAAVIEYGGIYGNADALFISEIVNQHEGVLVIVTETMNQTIRLERTLRFFLEQNQRQSLLSFPDWEVLPYDVFSPHQDISSQRLETLYRLPGLDKGIIILPISMLMQRVAPREFLQGSTLILSVGEMLNLENMRRQLEAAAYICVPQVNEHGEFAVRGSILDLFPSGARHPIRIDLFDNEIESIRYFDVENQRTIEKTDKVRLIPAREFPFTSEAISLFRQNWRERFEGDPQKTLIYRDVSQGIAPNGIEFYMPLFFSHTDTLFDYLPASAMFILQGDIGSAATHNWEEIQERYEQRRHNIERPILDPETLFLSDSDLHSKLKNYRQLGLRQHKLDTSTVVEKSLNQFNLNCKAPPDLSITQRHDQSNAPLFNFLQNYRGRLLFTAESEGRREMILAILREHNIFPVAISNWEQFLSGDSSFNICIGPLDDGIYLEEPDIIVISETQLFGERVQQRRRRKAISRDNDAIIRNLTELSIGAPVVHQDLGVGRYLGLQKIEAGGLESEYLALEYAGGDKLYVPVSSLHLISRYTGSSPETAPLHKLGTDQWEKAKRRAAEKVRDVAAELLEIYARREASRGYAFKPNLEEYQQFAAGFPFEETPDQENAINNVIADMQNERPMDRVVCGDVGFGKTEVAMRAAFIAVNDNKQVCVLVPTTLLAQQHYQNFTDRFAEWPVRVEVMSRFKTKKQTDQILQELAQGKIDIVIGTHKLLSDNVKFSDLGLLIVDEEHRFGVRQKEKIKAFVSDVDLLTLTATPIPRTLNMSLAGLRDLSIIATPPAHRLAVKTFVSQWDDVLLKEACHREIKRGGQIYFLHNDVASIERITRELSELIPDSRAEFAHGQMPEKQLEQIMFDFYHRRFNLLVCTTIIESGIDIPTANTIIINRADKLGLAQLHQLRGRVGRSHHRAYAYLFVPPTKLMTEDAKKRIDAIESLEDLGAGFMLASHDLEIRGAGELLGEEQSGQIQEVGFSLYSEMLERAVQSLKKGEQPQLDRPLDHGTEVELQIAALIPDDYIPDVHTRLTLYKRIASSKDEEELRDLQVEMIDRFGLLPPQLKNLVRITEIKLKATPLGIRKIEMHANGGRLVFEDQPNIDPLSIIQLIQKKPAIYKLDGQNKLRISMNLAEPEKRFERIEELLNLFDGKTNV